MVMNIQQLTLYFGIKIKRKYDQIIYLTPDAGLKSEDVISFYIKNLILLWSLQRY